LKWLHLRKNKGGDAVAEALAEADRFPHLHWLNLEGNGISTDGARQLARADWLGRLEFLGLSENPIGDEGVEALANSGAWAGLRILTLHGCGLTACGRHIAGSRQLAGLYTLSLVADNPGNIMGELARSAHLRQLRNLDLLGNPAPGEADVEALVRSPLASNLRSLRLSGLSRPAQRVLLTAPSLSGLTNLCIPSGNAGPADGLVGRWLREATHLEKLTHLSVTHSGLGDAGVTDLAHSPHLSRLVLLEVGYNGMTAVGLRALAESPYLNALKRLRVGYLYKPEELEVRKLLQARFGDVSA
jgi:hypothetical protein